MGERLDNCSHEAAHSVLRQLLIGDLGVTGLKKKKLAYSYPVERKPLDSMSKERLAKVAVIVAGGIVAEERLFGDTGIPKHLHHGSKLLTQRR